MRGRILKITETGSSNPRNVGIDRAVLNVAKAINKLPRKDVLAVFVGLPALEEEYKTKKARIEKEISKKISFSKVKIISDQLVAFRSGSEERDGVVIIAGTGGVVHGWHKGKEAKAGGWGWVADEGSGFSVFCDLAAKKGDRIARQIMIDAGKEIGFTAKAVIQKLKFKRKKFSKYHVARELIESCTKYIDLKNFRDIFLFGDKK